MSARRTCPECGSDRYAGEPHRIITDPTKLLLLDLNSPLAGQVRWRCGGRGVPPVPEPLPDRRIRRRATRAGAA